MTVFIHGLSCRHVGGAGGGDREAQGSQESGQKGPGVPRTDQHGCMMNAHTCNVLHVCSVESHCCCPQIHMERVKRRAEVWPTTILRNPHSLYCRVLSEINIFPQSAAAATTTTAEGTVAGRWHRCYSRGAPKAHQRGVIQ